MSSADDGLDDFAVGMLVAGSVAKACEELSKLALPPQVCNPSGADFDQFLDQWATNIERVAHLVREASTALKARFKEIEEGRT